MHRRTLLLLALTAALTSACNHDRGLTANGFARMETTEISSTGFQFPGDIRLDRGGATTGTCLITRFPAVGSEAESFGVVVDLYGNPTDEGLRSITVNRRTDESTGTVTAILAGGTYRSTAACVPDVEYVDNFGSVTLDATRCAMATEDSRTGTVDLHLELHGCDTTDAD